MATATLKRAKSAPRLPEKKWGPFAGGSGVAVWLNEFETDEGIRYSRSITLAPRRFKDSEGVWRDGAYRPVDLAALLLAIAAAQEYCLRTPLPGEPAEQEELDALTDGDAPPSDQKTPF